MQSGLAREVADALVRCCVHIAYCTLYIGFVLTGGTVLLQAVVDKAHNAKAKVVVATDLLALTMLEPPGKWGADMVVGSAQRFGVPMGYGGPHAAFLACSDAEKRLMPGRIIGKWLLPWLPL